MIFQGGRSSGELTELLSAFSNDLKIDGVITDSNLKNQLTKSLYQVSLREVRLNLEKRYQDIGKIVTIPPFEDYVKNVAYSEPKLIDIDGNEYNVVKIGNQFWMAENLRVSRFSNGDMLPLIENQYQWSENQSSWYYDNSVNYSGYCYVNNDSINNKIFGKLYNSFVLSDDRNICPTGWHVSTDYDWANLFDKDGAMYVEKFRLPGGKFLNQNSDLWTWSLGQETNEIGFSFLPGGYRSPYGEFSGPGFSGGIFQKTSPNNMSNEPYNHGVWVIDNVQSLNANGPNGRKIIRMESNTNFGASIRCVKD